ncbi:MAG: C25 family cysteine peptidase [bacterium]
MRFGALIGFCMVVFVSTGQAQIESDGNSTPTSSLAWHLDLSAWHTGLRPESATAMMENNYATTLKVCLTDPDSTLQPEDYVPESTFLEIREILGSGAGAGMVHSHGNSLGFAVEFYPYCQWGDSLREAAIADLVDRDYGTELARIEMPDSYYAIAIRYSAFPDCVVLQDAIIHNQTCDGAGGGRWPGSAVTVAPEGTCTYQQSVDNVREFWENLNGENGQEKRQVENALTDCPNLTAFGDEQRTLSPAVSLFSPGSNYQIPEGESLDVAWELDTHCNTSLVSLATDGVLQILNAGWVSTTRLEATVTGSMPGDGYLEFDAHSQNCDALVLKDKYYTRLRYGNDPNTACEFGQTWAFPVADGSAVIWVTDAENGSVNFEVLGGEDRELLATIPAAGDGVWPCFYELTLPAGPTLFQIRELVERNGSLVPATTSRPFQLAASPPADLARLRQLNQEVGHWMVPACNHRPGPVDAGGGASELQMPEVTDLVLYSSSSAFLEATMPIRETWLREYGWTSQCLIGSADPNECRSAMGGVWEEAINLGWRRLPMLVIVGEANQGAYPERNIVGTIYLDDASGNCFWNGNSGCAADGLLVDFDGDLLPDVPWSRIPVCTVAELENSVATAVAYCSGEQVSSPRVLILDGDLAICTPVTADPRAMLLEVQTRYETMGIPTTILHDSDYSCSDYAGRLTDATAVVNDGVTEIVGSGLFTRYNIWPGFFFQRSAIPLFTMDAVTRQQRVVVQLPGCGLGDCDRNVGDYPSISKRWLTADPAQHTTAVNVFGHARGGYRSWHSRLARTYFEYRFAYGMCRSTMHTMPPSVTWGSSTPRPSSSSSMRGRTVSRCRVIRPVWLRSMKGRPTRPCPISRDCTVRPIRSTRAPPSGTGCPA